ncbi:hypothetical protein [Rosistilla oblonga]|uniref:hypothetical protein n=1 Tax=Rosistilla oblonga TaxID=2527990 RepID=UPI003A969561
MTKTKTKAAPKTARKSKTPTMAETADKFLCYQKSVQSPSHEVEFFEQAFRDAFRRKPYTLREDFCGTFAVCCDWVDSNKRRTAIGVDLCDQTLQWGRDHNLSKLTEKQQSRVTLLQEDVRIPSVPAVDVLAAQNFSFWIFKTRPEVLEYFKAARANLNSEGIMVIDMMGGGACYEEQNVDKRTIKKGKHGFEYHWQQVSFNPVNADAHFRIDFKFADGSKMKNAFEYHWRFWTIPEVRELLAEAGFRESHVYWEQEEDAGKDAGEWRRGINAPSHPSWISYIVGVA